MDVVRDAPRDPLFDERNSRLVALLDSIYRQQVNLYFPLELSVFFTDERWHAAETVVDLGTGNGYFAARLARCFPTKRIIGVDTQREMITIAEREHARPGLSFLHADLFDASGFYDYAIARLVAQHVGKFDKLLEKVAMLVPKGGRFIVIDAGEEAVFFWPGHCSIADLYAAIANQRPSVGADYAIMKHARRLAEKSKVWAVEGETTLVIPSTVPGNRERFADLEWAVLDFAEAAGVFEMNFDELRRRWRQWCASERSYAHHRLDILHLERI